ncbi:MAG: NAD(P)H-hydrate dehydratase, partial [Anaerotignaceae bacterium]
DILKKMKVPPIITPHMGEFSRLTGLSIEEILQDTIAISEKFAKDYNCIVVLKDFRTIVATPEKTHINTTGNNAMAKGGSGDVLTGIIGGLLAQGMDSFNAARVGVYIHGMCGDSGAKKYGQYSLMATELIEEISCVIKNVL